VVPPGGVVDRHVCRPPEAVPRAPGVDVSEQTAVGGPQVTGHRAGRSPAVDVSGGGWPQAPRTTPTTSTSKGAVRSQRVGVAAAPAPSAGAAWAASLPASRGSQRTVAEGTKGPRQDACARQRVTLGQEGRPERPGWRVIKRRGGVAPPSSDSMSHAPASTSLRTLVWLSGLRGAVEQGCEEGKTERGMDHDDVRQYAGWHPHRLLTMLAHVCLWPRKLHVGKTAPALTVAHVRR
jgi:hypothetical protein